MPKNCPKLYASRWHPVCRGRFASWPYLEPFHMDLSGVGAPWESLGDPGGRLGDAYGTLGDPGWSGEPIRITEVHFAQLESCHRSAHKVTNPGWSVVIACLCVVSGKISRVAWKMALTVHILSPRYSQEVSVNNQRSKVSQGTSQPCKSATGSRSQLRAKVS